MVAFRLKYVATDVGLDHELSRHFDTRANESVTIDLRCMSETDAETDKPGGRGDLLCTAEVDKKATRNILQWLTSPTESLPVGFAEFADAAFDTLAEAIVTTLRLLRWRTGHRSTRDPKRSFKSFEWSTTNGTWAPVIRPLSFTLDVGMAQHKVTEDIVASIHDLWRNHVIEPLAHELFQEAWSQRKTNPKSSLVIGIAAAETAMKQLVSKLVPSSSWLMQNTQSPPLAQMLEEYLPLLPTRVRNNGVPLPPLPKALVGTIKDGVRRRNNIVHGKEEHVSLDSLRRILQGVHDVLYVCDVYAGQIWAMGCVTAETQAAWLKAEG